MHDVIAIYSPSANSFILYMKVHLQSNKSRLGLTQLSQLQNISSKVDDLLNRFRALTKRKDFAMRKDGNYTINGKPCLPSAYVHEIINRFLS